MYITKHQIFTAHIQSTPDIPQITTTHTHTHTHTHAHTHTHTHTHACVSSPMRRVKHAHRLARAPIELCLPVPHVFSGEAERRERRGGGVERREEKRREEKRREEKRRGEERRGGEGRGEER